MQRTVKVFVLASGRGPGGPPEPAQPVVVQANGTDELLHAARERLEAEGFQVRSLSFGPKGLVAYVEAAA